MIKTEEERVRLIRRFAKSLGVEAEGERAIVEGMSAGKFIDGLRAGVAGGFLGNATPLGFGDVADLGLSAHEKRSYSFCRLIAALSSPSDRGAQQAAAFEFEISDEARKRAKRSAASARPRSFPQKSCTIAICSSRPRPLAEIWSQRICWRRVSSTF